MRCVVMLLCLIDSSFAWAQFTQLPSGNFAPPLTGYVGRYLDAAQTPDPAGGDRLSAERIKVIPERDLILMNLGGKRLGAYRLHSFAQRVRSASLSTGPQGEKYLAPDIFNLHPQDAGSGWTTTPVDFREVLNDFDVDDRGYVYSAWSVWGFLIVDANGVKQSQVMPAGMNPYRILAVRDGSKVLAIASDMSSTVVYDVASPSAPIFVRKLPFGIAAYAKLASGAVAIIEVFRQDLRVYATARDLAEGNAPAQTFKPQSGTSYPVFLATDGTAIFTLPTAPEGSTYLAVLSPSGAQYVETRHPTIPGLLPVDVNYGAGFVTVCGYIFRAAVPAAGSIYRVDPFSQYELAEYFASALHILPGSGVAPDSLAPYAAGGNVYLIAAMNGVGDLFVIEQASTIPAMSVKTLLALCAVLAAIALFRLR